LAKTDLPPYVQVHRQRDGTEAFFWVRPTWANPKLATHPDARVRARAVRHGHTCPLESTPLGTVKGAAITKAEHLNEALDHWREGIRYRAVEGSVQWLFSWYRQQEKFKELAHKTRKGYEECMAAVEEISMKVGKFGTRQAGGVDGPIADRLYKKAVDKHGERQGSYMMQVCRLVWNFAARPGYSKITGVKVNPFKEMGITASSGTGKGNVAATRAQYDAYRAAAHELGYPSMAAAAALCFEGCQRVWDVFGFEDPDKRKVRGIFWSDYKPGEKISLIQSKTGKVITLPLTETFDGEVTRLYPELEDELASLPRTSAKGEMIVRREFDGRPYPIDYMPKIHGKILKKAKLPKEIRFTSFRHGGLTEIGDADITDSRAVSGHSKVETTLIYNKANVEKARKIAARRREHITMLEGGEEKVAAE
jgi:hypothetical protein